MTHEMQERTRRTARPCLCVCCSIFYIVLLWSIECLSKGSSIVQGCSHSVGHKTRLLPSPTFGLLRPLSQRTSTMLPLKSTRKKDWAFSVFTSNTKRSFILRMKFWVFCSAIKSRPSELCARERSLARVETKHRRWPNGRLSGGVGSVSVGLHTRPQSLRGSGRSRILSFETARLPLPAGKRRKWKPPLPPSMTS